MKEIEQNILCPYGLNKTKQTMSRNVKIVPLFAPLLFIKFLYLLFKLSKDMRQNHCHTFCFELWGQFGVLSYNLSHLK